MTASLFEKHLIINTKVRNPPRTADIVDRWLIELVDKVGMVILSGPDASRCNDPGNEGVTGTVQITTSHASIHVWDMVDEPYARFDLFSCRDFDINTVFAHLEEFQPYGASYIVLDRNSDIHVSAAGFLDDTKTSTDEA